MDTPFATFLLHHWYMARRGGERVFEQIAELFPEAEIGLLCLNREALAPVLRRRQLRVSFLRWFTPRFCDHRWLLPLYPSAVRRFTVPSGTKLLLSSDASIVKGTPKPPGCFHVCYCHSPPRYLWDLSEEYLSGTAGLRGPKATLFRKLLPALRAFDLQASSNVDLFIANSAFVAERIRRIYSRPSVVIHPGVEVNRFAEEGEPQDYYLVVAELVAYKRIDIAVCACTATGRKLVVVGDGPEAQRLKEIAGSNVRFVGRAPDLEVTRLMLNCRAFLHPQIEDFGVAAVEAQAAGRPVVAYRAGGALETVIEGVTGLFFDMQTPDALVAALDRFESARAAGSFLPVRCRDQAARFSTDAFRERLRATLAQAGFRSTNPKF